MRETNSQGKACVVPLAVAAGLGIAGMGLVSDGIVAADTTSVTDTINVTVQPSCTFNSVEDKTYIGSAANGAEVNNFNDSGIHEFNLFCNDNNGFIVTATPYNLEATGIEDVISYTDNYTHTGVDSMWTAEIASEATGVTVASPVPVGGGTIVSSGSSTSAAGVDFTATYKAYVGTATPAGTYTGTIVYTLTASGTSNGGNNSGSGNGGESGTGDNGGTNGESGTNSGNETTENTEGNGDSGNSGAGGSGSGTGSGDANSGGSSDAPEITPNNAPLASSNTYNTYSTTNTYNTTNYTGGGTGTTGTQVATSGNMNDTTNNATNGDSEGDSSTNSGYEKPLGVTTTSTSSSDENSGVDFMPLVVAGAIVATGGVAAVALARSNKEE